MSVVIEQFTHWATVILMMIGLYVVVARGNLIKKLVGLGVFQTSVYLLYIGPGRFSAPPPPSCLRNSRSIPIRCPMS